MYVCICIDPLLSIHLDIVSDRKRDRTEEPAYMEGQGTRDRVMLSSPKHRGVFLAPSTPLHADTTLKTSDMAPMWSKFLYIQVCEVVSLKLLGVLRAVWAAPCSHP